MNLYKHLTLKDRDIILKGLLNNLSYQETEFSKSTISLEISRNSIKEKR